MQYHFQHLLNVLMKLRLSASYYQEAAIHTGAADLFSESNLAFCQFENS